MSAVPKPQDARRQGQRTWTDAQRAEQARKLNARQIWRKSTGPRTWEGKRISSQNALKSGKFSAETKSIRTWLCFISRNLKNIKAALRHHDFTKRYARKIFSQNELIDRDRQTFDGLPFYEVFSDNIIPFPPIPPST